MPEIELYTIHLLIFARINLYLRYIAPSSGKEYYTSCFWDSQINPTLPGIGNGTDPNVIGATTAQMQTQSTFTDAGWDFVGETVNGPNDVWTICENTNYPKLQRQKLLTDLLCPDGVNFIDYAFFAGLWNTTDPNADFDSSGLVDFADVKLLGDDWLTGF